MSRQSQLHVLSVAYPLFPMRPGAGGGAEQVLGILDRGLVRFGHRSTVIAASGSQVSGELVASPELPQKLSECGQRATQAAQRRLIEETLRSHKVDVVHFHGLDFLEYGPVGPPYRGAQLTTLHLPVNWYRDDLFSQTGIAYNCVSATQAASDARCRALAVIPNGIEIDRFAFSRCKQDFLLWIGRICPEKGTDIALRVAHSLRLPLVVAGPVHSFEAHLRYFEERVKPLLDGHRKYIGAVEEEQRASLLAAARCVLIPALAAETSSLVAMEAACSGTPVVAFRSGALPEIVEDGLTGLLADSETDMCEKVGLASRISPAACRSVAERRFSAHRMVQDYLDLYGTLTRRA